MATHQLKPAAIGSGRASARGGGGARRGGAGRPSVRAAERPAAGPRPRPRTRTAPPAPQPRRAPPSAGPRPAPGPGAAAAPQSLPLTAARCPLRTAVPPLGIECLVPGDTERTSWAQARHVDPTERTPASPAPRLLSEEGPGNDSGAAPPGAGQGRCRGRGVLSGTWRVTVPVNCIRRIQVHIQVFSTWLADSGGRGPPD